MKKIVALLTVLMLMMTAPAMAADMGVQIIGGDESEAATPVSLDDLKLNVEIELPGYGTLKAVKYEIVNEFYYYQGPGTGSRTSKSGNDAEYMVLWFTLLNTKTTQLDFMKDISEIVATYDETYQYAGWTMQCDPRRKYPEYGIEEELQYALDPMYEGGFVIACTLPNAVVNGKKSLSLTFKLLDNEITYNARK